MALSTYCKKCKSSNPCFKGDDVPSAAPVASGPMDINTAIQEVPVCLHLCLQETSMPRSFVDVGNNVRC